MELSHLIMVRNRESTSRSEGVAPYPGVEPGMLSLEGSAALPARKAWALGGGIEPPCMRFKVSLRTNRSLE